MVPMITQRNIYWRHLEPNPGVLRTSKEVQCKRVKGLLETSFEEDSGPPSSCAICHDFLGNCYSIQGGSVLGESRLQRIDEGLNDPRTCGGNDDHDFA